MKVVIEQIVDENIYLIRGKVKKEVDLIFINYY